MTINKKRVLLWLPFLVAVLVFAVFLPSLQNGFLDWDDDLNFLDNPKYRGFAWENIKWMFTSFHLGPYVPLSWMTCAFDHLVWGMDPFGYHLSNVVLHSLNAAVFYLLYIRLVTLAAGLFTDERTDELHISAVFATLFFAIHPLRVEPVAWLSARHDMLACLFYQLALLSYTFQSPGDGYLRRHLPALTAFLLALFSKGMAVTLPAVLIVLDVYPLKRFTPGFARPSAPENRRIWLEKIPYFLMSLIFCVAGYAGQAKIGALAPDVTLDPGARVVQILFGLSFYIRHTLIPLGLSPFYSLPEGMGLLHWQTAASAVAIASITAAATLARGRWPAGLAAWSCYLIMISPVSGVLKMNSYAAADRYSYLACLPFAVLAGAGSFACLRAADRRLTRSVIPIACAILTALGILTWRQQKIWGDTEILWRHALSVYPRLAYAHRNLACALKKRGKIDEAIRHYEEAVRIDPSLPNVQVYLVQILLSRGQQPSRDIQAVMSDPERADKHMNRSGVLAAQGRLDEALKSGLEALRLDPDSARVRNNLGFIYAALGRHDDALLQYREALRIDPRFAPAHNNIAAELSGQGRFDEAVPHYLEAVRLKPDYAEAYYNMGEGMAAHGRLDEAVVNYRAALRINPGLAMAHNNLGTVLSAQGRLDDAVAHYLEAVKLKPDFAVAYYSLGAVLHKQGRTEEAGENYEKALSLNPGYAEAHYNLSHVLYKQGEREKALEHYRTAVRLDPRLAAASGR